MAMQRRISGVVDFRDAPKFVATVRAFKQKMGVQQRTRSGRGNRGWSKSRAFRPGGTLSLTGDVRMDGFPLPDRFKGQEGTIVLQFHQTGSRTATQTLTVRVDDAEISLAKDVEDGWTITLACTILANPALEGFGGTQPVATDPTKSDQETDAGLSKTYDPNTLVSAATRSWDVWPLGDSDNAELQRIAALIAAANPPFPGAKVKFARLEPDRDDEGGTVTANYSLTDTVEDVVNPITQTTVDPNGLTSSATAAAVNGDPLSPGGDFVDRETTTQEIHDAATLARRTFGLRDTRDDVEMDGTSQTLDPNRIDSSGQATQVYDTASPAPADPAAPSSELQLVARTVQKRNRKKSVRTAQFDVTNSIQKRTFPQTHVEQDPQDIESWQSTATTWTVSAPEDPGSPGAALKLHHKFDVPITPERFLRVYLWRKLDTVDELTFPQTQTTTDGSDLETNSSTAVVYPTGAPPVDPTPPAGTRLVFKKDHPIHDAKTLRVYVFQKDTTAEKLLQEHTVTNTDPSALRSTATRAALDGTPTGPGGSFSERNSRVVPVTHDHTLTVKEYGMFSTEEEEEYGASTIADDPQDLYDERVIAEVQTSETPDPAPSGGAPAGLKKRDVKTRRLTPARWLHAYVYSRRDKADDLLMEAWRAVDDPSDLEETGVVLLIAASATPPAVPTSPVVNAKYIRTDSRQIHDQAHAGGTGKWAHTFYFGPRTSAEDITLPNTVVGDDPKLLDDQDRATIIDTNAAAPAAPANAKGLLHVATESVQLTNGPTPQHRHTYHYARVTSQDKIEMPQTVTRRVGIGPGESSVASVIGSGDADWGDGTASGIGQAVFNRLATGAAADKTFGGVVAEKLNANKALKKIITVPDSRIVRASSFAGTTEVKAWMLGSAVVVWVSEVVQRGSNQTWFYVESRSLRRMVKHFEIRRRIKASVVNELVDYAGTSNEAPFMGFPRWTVTFAGIDVEYDRLTPAPRLHDVAWKFRFDSAGQFDDTGVRLGWNFTNDDLGDVAAPSINFALRFGWPAAMLTPANYNIFTDPALEGSLFT